MSNKFSDYKMKDLDNGPIKIHCDVLVQNCCKAKTKTGDDFLKLTICDGVSSMQAVMFGITDDSLIPKTGDVVCIVGFMKLYNNSKSLTINSIIKSDVDPNTLLKDKINSDEYLLKLLISIDLITDKDLANGVSTIISDNKKALITVPAAVGHHHAYKGGLLEHTVEVATLAYNIAKSFSGENKINIDLVIAGAILHDIGKCVCYKLDNLVPTMTEVGKLHDHIIEGCIILKSYQDILGKYYPLLDAIIASHHENLEWGSPVRPSFPEALIVARADNLSSSINAMLSNLEKQETKWSTTKNKSFDAYLLNNKLEE